MTNGTTQELPVKVHLKTSVQQDGNVDTYELSLFGRYYQKGQAAYLKYDEVNEEGTIHTVVKLSNDNALILRGGALKMRLPFTLRQQKNGSYESPYGTLLLSVKTKELDYRASTDGSLHGTFSVQYDLFMQEELTGKYDMTIQYREVKEFQ